MSIESREAAAALSDIEDIVRRVRQSRTYQLASLLLIMWGALVFAANIGSFLWPRMAGYIWIAVNVAGIAGSFAISAFGQARTGVRSFDGRALAALLLFFAFGLFTCWLGHFGPRELGTFWPIYFMLMYTIVGLWGGKAFVAIGLSITALTLIGYFFVGPWFEPWMAFVIGGGLMLGGLWLRRN
ncbi:MAG: hypothetical protein Q8K85_08650 [Hyphomicrobium sp.]|nr:hypothetical protein [Hyphomicrobium sp.]